MNCLEYIDSCKGSNSKKMLFYVLFLLLTTHHSLLTAQDIHFSQFFEAPLLRNPSLAGIFEGDIRVQGVYRDQWNSITNAYRSGSLNAEYKMPVGSTNDFLTAGVQILYDKAGTAGLTTTHFLPALNYHKALSNEKRMYLSVGFMGGLVQNSIDRSKITTNNQYDGTAYNPALADGESFQNTNYSYFDGSVGASFNTALGTGDINSFFVGIAYHHFNRPRNSFYLSEAAALNPKYVFSTGVKFNVGEYTYLTLQADHSIQGPYRETIGGVLYSFKVGEPDDLHYTLHGGAFLRWGDALIPVIKLDYHPFSVALSYDVNISPLKTVSQGRGGIELSVSWLGFLDRDHSSRDKVLCPKF